MLPTGCSVVIHVDGCQSQLTVPCTTIPETPEVTQHREVQRSSGPQQPAKGPLALVRRQIAKLVMRVCYTYRFTISHNTYTEKLKTSEN